VDKPKRNFRYDEERWRTAVEKTVQMRRLGYPVSMTQVLSAEVDRFIAEDVDTSVRRLGLAETSAS
jgi:hypothetical protein